MSAMTQINLSYIFNFYLNHDFDTLVIIIMIIIIIIIMVSNVNDDDDY